jgi:hypothetical protein
MRRATPYTADGPVVEKGKELRAVTIFELKDLVQAAGEKNRHVILMARQCGICGHRQGTAQIEVQSLKSKVQSPDSGFSLSVFQHFGLFPPPSVRCLKVSKVQTDIGMTAR